VQPYNTFLNSIYNTTGILWQNYVVPSPFHSYYFDSQTPYANPGTNSWNIDTYAKGLQSGLRLYLDQFPPARSIFRSLLTWVEIPACCGTSAADLTGILAKQSQLPQPKGFSSDT
jgi:hypothetical protein